MDWLKGDLVGVLQVMLPGFFAAWIFHALTAHPKREPFERLVQAIIFTVVVRFLLVLVKPALLFLGSKVYAFGPWTDDVGFGWSVVAAAVVGTVVAHYANKDSIGWLRKLTNSKRTTYPSEWSSAFHKHVCYVVLHLKGGRRLRGWPTEYPDACDKGHFLLDQPAWVMDTGGYVPLSQLSHMLVAATDVEMVEFERPNEEVTQSAEQIAEVQKPLRALHEEKPNGKQIIVP